MSWLTKSLVPSVLARLGSLSPEGTFLRTWSQVSWLTKSLVPSVLAQLGSLSPESTFLRTWSQVSWLTKSLVPSVLAQLGSLSPESLGKGRLACLKSFWSGEQKGRRNGGRSLVSRPTPRSLDLFDLASLARPETFDPDSLLYRLEIGS